MTPDQMRWGMLGLLVGDALGVPYEFSKPEQIPPYEEIEFEPPKGFSKAYPNVPPGTWSDDGSQALALLDVLLRGGDHEHRFMDLVGEHLLAWRTLGRYAVDAHVFDIGIVTNKALNMLQAGVSATESGQTGERTKSNGSLMRTLPIAFFQGTNDEILRAAMGQSKVTHAEIDPMLCCGLYCLWARGIAAGSKTAWEDAFEIMHQTAPKGVLTSFIEHIRLWRGPCTGSGYCIDSLHSAKMALERGTDYESTVRAAIQFGNDTDTTAAIVGGLAGIRYQAIPERWLQGLRGRDILDPMLEGLTAYGLRTSRP